MPCTGDLACNPGMCPDWESIPQCFGLQAGAQSTEPHQPGLYCNLKIKKKIKKLNEEKFLELKGPKTNPQSYLETSTSLSQPVTEQAEKKSAAVETKQRHQLVGCNQHL